MRMDLNLSSNNYLATSSLIPVHALYIHIPFCAARCSYCAFNIETHAEAQIPAFIAALRNEITNLGRTAQIRLNTVYFGGGTPSLLPPDEVNAVLQTVHSMFNLATDAEISFEA